MTEPLQVGQFAIVDHEPVDRGPNAGIFHGRGPADDRAELYLVAEGTTPAGEAFAGHVVSAVGHSWGSYDMSLTGALRQLFREAARNLSDWNQKSIAQHRVSIGITCFARRGSQAVIAQAGPSVAFHLSGGRLEMYAADEEHGQPIGAGGPVEPQLTRIAFGAGDRLLIISTAALRVIDDEIFAGVMGLPVDQILPELYQRVNDLRDVTVFLVTDPSQETSAPAIAAAALDPEYVIGATPSPATPAETPGEGDGFQASLFIDAADAVEVTRRRLLEVSAEARVRVMTPGHLALDEDVPTPLRRVAGESLLAQLAAERQARVADSRARMQAAAGAMPGTVARPGYAQPDSGAGGATQRTRRSSASFSRGLSRTGDVPPIPPAPSHGGAPLAEDMAREFRARAASGPLSAEVITAESMASRNGASVVRVRDSMGGRWKGNGSVNRRTINAGGQPPAWLVLVLGVGLLIALVGALTLPGLVQEKEGQQYLELVDGARQRLATAAVQEDPGQRRTALVEARELLLQASDIDPASGEVQGLLEQATAGLTALDAVVVPAAVEVISDLREFGDKPVTVSKMVVGASHAYLFDSNAGQVIAVSLLSGDKEVIYTEDAATGRTRPVTVALVEDHAFGGETVLVVSAASKLWGYTAGIGLRELAFARPQGMTISDMTITGTTLYILDANAATISRMEAADGGYGAPPQVVISDASLAAGRRLYSGDDEFVTSDADGALHWFSGRTAIDIPQSGIDQPLAAAESPQAMGAGGEYGLADARANRIVVVQRDGTFVRQYRHSDFDGLMSFAVRDGQAYVFSGGYLRLVTW
ncbi:MAG TPA: hypothetical protein VFK32_07575 [Tepidiformaceae bacterium]|nr:hypothetical protein [Tepidiformaceae bacterium]